MRGEHDGVAVDEALSRLDFPMLVVELTGRTIIFVARAALEQLGLPAAAVVGHPVDELLSEEDRPRSRASLDAVEQGAIDFYRAHRPLRSGYDTNQATTEWVRRLDLDGRPAAMVELAFGEPPRPSPLAVFLGKEPLILAVGTTDVHWIVKAVSDDITTLVGLTPAELVGQRLLNEAQQADVTRFTTIQPPTGTEYSVSLTIEIAGKPLCCILTSLGGSTCRAFILISDPRNRMDDRTSRLEHHLWRIAAEVEASGILQRVGSVPDPTRYAELRALSVRQWEVLSRLMQGQRVPAIAAEMFISPSTVRNHLAAIFERFGVHSQAELLAKLRASDAPSS